MRNVTINHSLSLGKSSREAKLRTSVYLVRMDSEQGKQFPHTSLSFVGTYLADVHVWDQGTLCPWMTLEILCQQLLVPVSWHPLDTALPSTLFECTLAPFYLCDCLLLC
jgi:hypothetical protein